jgi:urease accessory protein
MPRAQRLLGPGEPAGEIVDTLLLKFAERRKPQTFVFGVRGTCIGFDFAEPPRLRTDDLVLLEGGTLVQVVAEPEPVLEVRAKDIVAVMRLVWTLGNRHVPVQVLANRIRVLHSPENEAMLAAHGMTSTAIMAPFEPDDDDGAHDGVHRHDHTHDRALGHEHADHHHGHGHAHHHHGHEHAHHADPHDHLPDHADGPHRHGSEQDDHAHHHDGDEPSHAGGLRHAKPHDHSHGEHRPEPEHSDEGHGRVNQAPRKVR